MPPVTLHALALARTGYWQLLDALELVSRAEREPALAGMCHATGAIALLGYAGASLDDDPEGEAECAECEGDGEVEAMGASGRSRYVSCPWCDGEGTVDEADPATEFRLGDVSTWRTLGGEPAEFDSGHCSYAWLSVYSARSVVQEYTRLVDRLRGGS